MKREANKAKWHGLINEQTASGQTQAQWCAENAINIHNFRYWKSRLTSERDKIPKSNFEFVSLKPSVKSSKALTVRIGSASIEVHDAANLSLLEAIVKVLMHYA
ncbi:IS66 family insertion sequence element accessory protein TnpA [Fusibacter sp. JL298sf-3]